METHKELNSPKRCDVQHQKPSNGNFNVSIIQKYQPISFKNENMDEPIDLTVSPTDLTYNNKKVNDVRFPSFNKRGVPNVEFKNKKLVPRLESQPFQIVGHSKGMFLEKNQYDSCPSKRKKRRKFAYTTEGNLVLVTENLSQAQPAFTQAKQVEILKAAKSLFSKRTRTLYHWMYPSASKHQIKTTVMTSWDSLAESEKAFYISQVLGRFGLSQSNLMVNPQLDTIKEPPPLVERVVPNTKSLELQSAISSISPGTACVPIETNSLTFEEFEAMNEITRKRRGRPKRGNQGNKKVKSTTGDFQDDPELSQELEKFAVKFDLNRLF